MEISAKDKAIVFKYLKESTDGITFNRLLEPEPRPVMKHGACMLASVREIESEESLVFEFWEELKAKFLIRPVDKLNPEYFVLTKKGKQVAESQNYDLDARQIDLKGMVGDDTLLSVVASSFDSQQFEDAVFKAFKHVEERVRAKAELPSKAIGAQLMTQALHPDTGVLCFKNLTETSEKEGLYLLFKGGIQSFKNPSSHRTVDWKDHAKAVQAILFADFLLKLLNETSPR